MIISLLLGISTLQNFHTELIDGDPKINLVFAAAITLRIFILMASKSFRLVTFTASTVTHSIQVCM